MKVRRPTALRVRRTTMARRPLLEVCEDRTLLATFIVTNNADSGTGSLRDAITQANSNGQADLIQFNLPTGELKIRPATPLPDLTAPGTNIDATTQPGYTPGRPLVEISGESLPTNTPGFVLKSSGNAIRGLVINRFPGAGGDAIQVQAPNNRIVGNFIGIDVAGNAALPNGGSGIFVDNVAGTTIGGTTVTERNVISGNSGHGIMLFSSGASRSLIQGNYIGTNSIGTTRIGNGANGIISLSGTSNTIGGTTFGSGNVVSGNNTGVLLQASGDQGNVVQGNLIGTNANGSAALGNTFNGLVILGSGRNSIGANGSASTNVISGNGRAGIQVQGSTSRLNLIRNNFIGVGVDGTTAIGNATEGVWNFGGVDNFIGGLSGADGNIIANNGSLFNNDGIYVNGGSGVLIGGNSIYNNVGLGIRLSTGSNNDIASPVITRAETASGFMNIVGSFVGAPNTDYNIQFFSNKTADPSGRGEGRTFLPASNTADSLAVRTNGSGLATINVRIRVDTTQVTNGDFLTATATRAALGDTSEFSVARLIGIAPTTDLSVAIAPPASPVLLGSSLNYVVTVSNLGPNGSTGSTLTFNLDPSTTLQSVSLPYTQVANTLTIAIPPVPSTGSTTVTIVATPTRTGQINVDASVAGVEIDNDPVSNSTSASSTVLPSSDLGVSVIAPSSSPVGDTLTYVISGFNAGPSVATSAAVDFTLPANATFVSGELSVAGNVGTPVGNVVTSTIASIPVGAPGNFTLRIVIRPNTVGTAVAQVAIRSAIGDPVSGNNIATPSVTIVPAADLSVTVTSQPDPILLNQELTYTVTVRNSGPSAATGVQVVSTLDASLINIVPSLGTYDSQTGKVTALLPTIASGTTSSFTIRATPTVSRQIVNSTTVSNTAEVDSNATNNSQSVSNPVSPVDLSVVGSASPSPATVGNPLFLSYTVANAGPSPATGVVFSQSIPAGWTVISSAPFGVTVNGSSLTMPLGQIDANAALTVSITLRPSQSGPFVTTATVASTETDTNIGNNTGNVNILVSPADLGVSVSTSTAQALLGDTTTFTVQLVNNGPSPANEVSLSNVLTGTVQVVSATSSLGTLVSSGNNFNVSIPRLDSNAVATLTIVVRSQVAGAVTSTANALAREFDPVPANNTATRAVSYINTPGVVQLSGGAFTVSEDVGSITLQVNRTQGNQGAVTINYATSDGTAKAGINYQATSGTLSFGAGETVKTIIIPIKSDGVVTTSALNFSLALSSPVGGVLLGNQSSATISVVNTDIDQNPPSIASIQPTFDGRTISKIVVKFDQSVVEAAARNPANYSLVVSGRDMGTADTPVQITGVVYDAALFQTTLTPASPLPANVFYRIVVSGSSPNGIQNGFGTFLDGAGVRGTDFVGTFAAGTRLSYFDATGNLVSYRLTGGGSLTVNRAANGDASLLQLNGLIGRARQVLSGSVKRVGPAATGVTRINTLLGIGAFGDVFVKMTTPPFYVPNIVGFKASSISGLLPKTPKVKPTTTVSVPKGPLKPLKV